MAHNGKKKNRLEMVVNILSLHQTGLLRAGSGPGRKNSSVNINELDCLNHERLVGQMQFNTLEMTYVPIEF